MLDLETVPEISIDALLARSDPRSGRVRARLVDVRSPVEFEADHVPGAISIPLFDDHERAVVGTLYRQVGPTRAREWGEERVLARIAEFRTDLERGLSLAEFRAGGEALVPVEEPAVVMCARGGLRSQAVTQLLRGRGHSVVRLSGGYRAYRQTVRDRLGTLVPPRPIVLHGLTGVGKTAVLREVMKRFPDRVLDLEGLAGHRSSVLGAVGLEPATQKQFESRLCRRLVQLEGPWTLSEWESRRLGDREIPGALHAAMSDGDHLMLTADLETRVDQLVLDYVGPGAPVPGRTEALRKAVASLERFDAIGAEGVVQLDGWLRDGEFSKVATMLLERHYDPRYQFAQRGRAIEHSIHVRDPVRAAEEVLDWIETRR
ncbi:MAG: tRNA 2-selenouridine(34) synthase MnmH [Planctomycetota bacterium]